MVDLPSLPPLMTSVGPGSRSGTIDDLPPINVDPDLERAALILSMSTFSSSLEYFDGLLDVTNSVNDVGALARAAAIAAMSMGSSAWTTLESVNKDDATVAAVPIKTFRRGTS